MDSFIHTTVSPNNFIFCPKNLFSEVLDLFVKHYHQHPLIPFSQNEFLSFLTIQKNAIREMYLLCFKHNLTIYGHTYGLIGIRMICGFFGLALLHLKRSASLKLRCLQSPNGRLSKEIVYQNSFALDLF